MKVINNLLILEVPKGADEPTLTNGNGLMVFFDTKPVSTATRYQLPPGQYEIIGLLGELNDGDIDAILSAAGSQYNCSNLYELLTSNGIHYIGNLLFIHKIKT